MKKQQNRKKFLSFKLFCMDMARLVCACLLPIYRMKRLSLNGSKYRNKLKGGAVIVANHTSFQDPFLVGVTFWYRRMHFLVADVVMGGKMRSLLLRGVGAIEINRDVADIEAIRKAVDVLQQGRLLTVFPQGGIVREQGVETIKSGAVLMAIQADVPIVPVHIYPRKHWYHRRKVVIGEPLYPRQMIRKKFPSTADINHVSEVLMDRMNQCVIPV